MTIFEAIAARHSVRSYLDKPIPSDIVDALNEEISACNAEGGLHIQLVTNEPKAFDCTMARFGKFTGVKNYLAFIAQKDETAEERIGYYGERTMIKAQMLGLNTCWVASTYSKDEAKKHCVIGGNEKLICVASLGYGATQGVPHKSKELASLCSVEGETPDWFHAGMEAVLLAPTAINQQRFRFSIVDGKAVAKSLGGVCSEINLGIVKYHFEIGSGRHVG